MKNKEYVYPADESRGYHYHPYWDVMTDKERRKICPSYLSGKFWGGMKEPKDAPHEERGWQPN